MTPQLISLTRRYVTANFLLAITALSCFGQSIYPGQHKDKVASVGELVYVQVGHFAVVGYAQTYPVLAFATFYHGQFALVHAVFEYYSGHSLYFGSPTAQAPCRSGSTAISAISYGSTTSYSSSTTCRATSRATFEYYSGHSLYFVGGFGQFERVVLFGAAKVLGRAFEHFPVQILGIVVYEVAVGERPRIERAHRYGRIAFGDVEVEASFKGQSTHQQYHGTMLPGNVSNMLDGGRVKYVLADGTLSRAIRAGSRCL